MGVAEGKMNGSGGGEDELVLGWCDASTDAEWAKRGCCTGRCEGVRAAPTTRTTALLALSVNDVVTV